MKKIIITIVAGAFFLVGLSFISIDNSTDWHVPGKTTGPGRNSLQSPE
jgi:hypothetical protein